MEQKFKIKTESFEGPLDLLLDLVEKRKLHINDIALAAVTDDYLKHIESIPSIHIADRADFIVIASTLLLIKSRSLLPTISLSEDEEGSIENLELRLKMLQIIRDASTGVHEQFGKKMIFGSDKSGIKTPVFSPHKTITLENIKLSLESIINRLPKKQELQKAVVRKVISLEETINNLASRIQTGLSLSFRQFSGGNKPIVDKEKKVEVIVSFLAMLELVKQGIIDCMQDKHFEDIKMETTESLGVPKYNS